MKSNPRAIRCRPWDIVGTRAGEEFPKLGPMIKLPEKRPRTQVEQSREVKEPGKMGLESQSSEAGGENLSRWGNNPTGIDFQRLGEVRDFSKDNLKVQKEIEDRLLKIKKHK